MATHWEETTALFGVLAYLVKTSDRDGIELFFSVSSNSFLSKNSSSLVDVVRKHKAQGNSKIATQIASILEKYRSKLTQNEKKRILFPRKVQPLNLYILTDGLWGLDFDPSSVIRNFVDLLAKLKLDRNQVGIQFISFGNDPIGLERLEQLDDSLGAQVYVSRQMLVLLKLIVVLEILLTPLHRTVMYGRCFLEQLTRNLMFHRTHLNFMVSFRKDLTLVNPSKRLASSHFPKTLSISTHHL